MDVLVHMYIETRVTKWGNFDLMRIAMMVNLYCAYLVYDPFLVGAIFGSCCFNYTRMNDFILQVILELDSLSLVHGKSNCHHWMEILIASHLPVSVCRRYHHSLANHDSWYYVSQGNLNLTHVTLIPRYPVFLHDASARFRIRVT